MNTKGSGRSCRRSRVPAHLSDFTKGKKGHGCFQTPESLGIPPLYTGYSTLLRRNGSLTITWLVCCEVTGGPGRKLCEVTGRGHKI